ncbi:MAG: hypothetical protein QW273_03100 [Candidatus Pacearchaeota archaeon]
MKKEQRKNKEAVIVLSLLLLIFGGFLAGYFYVYYKNNFEYAGQNFTKIKEGNLEFYYTKFPIIYKQKLTKIFNVYLREDPRKNNIPINTNISFSREVIFSLDKEIDLCKDSGMAQLNLNIFISSFPWVKNVSVALTEEDYALEKNKLLIKDCSNATEDRTIILVKKSDKSSIEKKEENCYIFYVNNCEYQKVAERFIVGVIAQVNDKKI